jgi:hypothetical protein
MARLGWPEEVFYRRLISVVDDFGRYYADPGMLRAACYPRQLGKVSDSDIGKWLQTIAAAALVRVYPVDGEVYLEVLDFGQQVRAKKSKFPDMQGECLADAKQPPANAHLGVFVSGDVVESGEPTQRATRLPAAWELPQDWKAWARENRPDLDPDLTAAKFADYWHAKPGAAGRKLDWLATWRNWVREERTTKAGVVAATVPFKANPDSALEKMKRDVMTPEEREAASAARRAAMAGLKTFGKVSA